MRAVAPRNVNVARRHETVEGRKILHRYASWHLRRLRRRRCQDITHTRLTVVRQHLRAAGIPLAETRSTALFQLATELPAAILARTLGIGITVAVK
ncbi:hypothetical protein PUR34_05230 [Streptomyces sp. JV185]|uniref:hypothetical protein n=1 Tax=Streptomyces sp. JV185 TaxID=858638 RepID=UPI002E7A5D26|nr:hypothetical protein [Streptomyces sp. JV185]MEE1767596.1 hypothetical protein [Streptomyces sp. JV185]